jgi:hypothetical protein
MELWIRSQDKCRLVPNPNLYAVFDKDNNIAYIGDKMVGHIGKYKSLERALEVLNEIQSILKPIITYTQKEPIKSDLGQGIYQIKQDVDLKIQQLSTYVYEMPKE